MSAMGVLMVSGIIMRMRRLTGGWRMMMVATVATS
ncbi:hypothetical protein Poly21_08120 [Allorhodopirellula heiligendammensis]|uniref:Uncharacterized protein n=1 Tax=Allorhodopirellula heiligendammensis TaxID=2714739 RepID=A0A5C6C3C9_9BACT|nr:hypothetical protein Poly21_08120 [Allorhodopirellula heiligendammensis]